MEKEDKERFDFVVFCAEEDTEFAREIYTFLESDSNKLHGYLVGRDDELGEYTLTAATNIIEEVEKVLLLLSRNSLKEGIFMFHSVVSMNNAILKNIPKVIPMYLGMNPRDSQVPNFLLHLTGINCSRDYKQQLLKCFRKSERRTAENGASQSQASFELQMSNTATIKPESSKNLFHKVLSIWKK